ncbi:MAG: hypothetical protein SVG88_13480 [Halobacteriales archaeon]|nr:hypothetical protein [Halobacteriales archaeon]
MSNSYGSSVDILAGGLSGLAGGVFAGIVLELTNAQHVLTQAIPALFGLSIPATIVGWGLFLALSFGFGILYAGLFAIVDPSTTTPSGGGVIGAFYGLVLWLVVAVVFVPLATSAVGYGGAPPFPYIDPVALVGYVSYGIIIGGFYAILTDYRFQAISSDPDVPA